MHFRLITKDPDVREFQVLQNGERLTLRVVLGHGADDAPTRLRETMTAQLRKIGVARPLIHVDSRKLRWSATTSWDPSGSPARRAPTGRTIQECYPILVGPGPLAHSAGRK